MAASAGHHVTGSIRPPERVGDDDRVGRVSHIVDGRHHDRCVYVDPGIGILGRQIHGGRLAISPGELLHQCAPAVSVVPGPVDEH